MACENINLQRRAKISSILDMIISTFGIIAAAIDVYNLLREDERDDKEAVYRRRALAVLYVNIAGSVIKFLMGVTLWKGAKSRNDKLCTQWLYVSGAMWTVEVVAFIIKLIIGTFVLLSTIMNSLAILIRVLVMFTVFRFIEEIRSEKPTSINSSHFGIYDTRVLE